RGVDLPGHQALVGEDAAHGLLSPRREGASPRLGSGTVPRAAGGSVLQLRRLRELADQLLLLLVQLAGDRDPDLHVLVSPAVALLDPLPLDAEPGPRLRS